METKDIITLSIATYGAMHTPFFGKRRRIKIDMPPSAVLLIVIAHLESVGRSRRRDKPSRRATQPCPSDAASCSHVVL
jgi:hypothetical protein